MKEAIEALAPWPVIQGIVIGLIIAGIGIWAMVRGMREGTSAGPPTLTQVVRVELTDEEKRREWEAFRDIDHLSKNSFEIVRLLEQMVEQQRGILEAVNRFNDNRWNVRQ